MTPTFTSIAKVRVESSCVVVLPFELSLPLSLSGVATELHMSGPKASTQLDKLNGLLKDAPQKYNLQKEGLRLDSIPPLDMMHNNSVDSRLGAPCTEREEGTVYLPGPSNKRSWKLDSNVIPVRGQRGNKWGERTEGKLHTQDFRYLKASSLIVHVSTRLIENLANHQYTMLVSHIQTDTKAPKVLFLPHANKPNGT